MFSSSRTKLAALACVPALAITTACMGPKQTAREADDCMLGYPGVQYGYDWSANVWSLKGLAICNNWHAGWAAAASVQYGPPSKNGWGGGPGPYKFAGVAFAGGGIYGPGSGVATYSPGAILSSFTCPRILMQNRWNLHYNVIIRFGDGSTLKWDVWEDTDC